ncbi:unnamed protein product [Symbiodinium sp. CCMP2592]|nr:unnamed protein product [Symbiodinium sp. CCMP2592]
MKGLYGALKKAEVTTVRPYRDLPLELRHHERRLDWQRLWEPSSNHRALEDPIFSRLLELAVEQHHALGPVSAEELTKVLKKLSTKAPGLDGLTAPMLKRASVLTTGVTMLPKKPERERPIGLTSYGYRIWARSRWPVYEKWARAYAATAPWDGARQGASSLDIALARLIRSEVNHFHKTKGITLLLDLREFYEHVDLVGLTHSAMEHDFPPIVLHHCIQLYTHSRYICTEGVLASPVRPTRGVIAGCPFAPGLSKLVLHPVMNVLHHCPSLHNCDLYIDDSSFDVEDASVTTVVHKALEVWRLVKQQLTQRKLPISIAKSAWVCSSREVEKKLSAHLGEADPQIQSCWRDLGVDSAGGKRRRVTIHKQRFRKAGCRSQKLTQLRAKDAARKKAAKAGVEAAAAYGHQAVGLAPKQLKFLRQLTAQHNGRLTNGATEVVLDLLCTTKPDPSGRLVEQHFRSFVAMTGNWPQALKPALENAFEVMSQRVASHKEPWRIAAGPMGATLCYLKELGWQPSSLLRWEIHSQHYDLEDPLQLEGMLRLLRTFWANKRLQAICQLEGGASLATGVDWTIGKRLLRKLPPLQKKSLQAVWQGILAAPRWTWFNQSEHKQSDSISIGSVVTNPWSAVDKLAGDHANRSRDRLWESQLEARDADASAVLSFLAARAAALFEYDQDQGPQIQFEGEASSQNQKGRASGFKRKGKVIRPEPAKTERQAGKPNKRDLLREAVLKPQLGHTWKWTSEHQSGARISCTTCKLGAQQISPEKQLRRTLAQPCIGHCSQELFLSFWQCHPTHHMVFERPDRRQPPPLRGQWWLRARDFVILPPLTPRSKSSREYSQRRAGKKQRAAGQYYRWSRPLPAEPAQHHDTPPPPPVPGRGGRKEADDESAASYSYYSSSRSRSPRGRNKEQGRGKAKPVQAPARSSGKMAVKSKAKPPPEAEVASGSLEAPGPSAPSSSQAGVPPPEEKRAPTAKEKDSPASAEGDQESPAGSVAAKEESSDSCYEPIRLRPAPLSSPLRRALPVPDLGMQFTIQLKDASKEACSGRYLHAASLVYFAHQDRQGAEPGSPQKVATALEVLGLGGSRVVFRSPSNPAKCWKLSKRSQEAERDLFKVTGPWTPRHTRALGVHRVVEEGKGGTSFFASLLETELVDPLPMVNPPLIFQISLTVCQAAKFANIRDLGRKNMGSRSMPQGMGDPPRYEVLLLDANDWEEYGSQTTPHWPNKRRAQGFWSTVGSFAPDLLDPLFALVKQNQADLQALTQGIYNLMGRTLNKGEMDDVLEALVSTQALGISPEGHICQYVLKQGGPHPLVPGQTWELHPLETFQFPAGKAPKGQDLNQG